MLDSTFVYRTYKEQGLTPRVVSLFRNVVYDYYTDHKRSFPWRDAVTPYGVFISEIMLQQTQAGIRTVEKFNAFMARFPDFGTLAAAPLSEILKLWQGLGYNRRALALKKAAETIVRDHQGILPRGLEALDDLPGIGPATACSISAFAFNLPVVFIETNVRTVFIYHFFADRDDVSDSELVPLVEQTLDRENSREWYSALMDYGSRLKKEVGNKSRQSKHYVKQSTFEGSDRQLRGTILRLLAERLSLPCVELPSLLSVSHDRAISVIETLINDGLVIQEHEAIRIS